MRVKEWYGWHFPEMQKIVPDNILYARTVKALGMYFTLARWLAAVVAAFVLTNDRSQAFVVTLPLPRCRTCCPRSSRRS